MNLNLTSILEPIHNYIRCNLITVVFLLLIALLIAFILFTIVTYYAYKWLQIGLDQNNMFFYKYNKKSQQILDKYGDCSVEAVYLVRQPFARIINIVINIFTLGQYNAMIKESPETNLPHHSLLVFRLKLENKQSKFVLLEKNNCINLTDNFVFNHLQDVKQIKINNKNKIKKTTYTLKCILEKTQNRIGPERFFNWNLCKNNCHEFTKEVLVTLGKLTNEHKEYIQRDKMIYIIKPSEFTLHLVNSICIVYNIIEKYILDNNYF